MAEGLPCTVTVTPLVMVMDTADELGQVGLDVAKRKHGHSQKYDQKILAVSKGALPATVRKFVSMRHARGRFSVRELTSGLGSGGGFEPATSGL